MGTLKGLFLDEGFWTAMLGSRTFWHPQDHGALVGTFCAAAGALVLMLSMPALSARRRPLRRMHADVSGSATAIDLVLVTPLFVFFMFLVFQFAILAKNHLFTHYAAYSAARSARVYFCPKFPITGGAILDGQFNVKACDDNAAPAKAEMAARIALIPAAPYKNMACGGCTIPDAALRGVIEATGLKDRWGAVTRQARYMFDKSNVTVSVRTAPMATFAAARRSPHVPVIATVTARFLLLDYAGWVFADGRRKDGRYYMTSTAEVSLL